MIVDRANRIEPQIAYLVSKGEDREEVEEVMDQLKTYTTEIDRLIKELEKFEDSFDPNIEACKPYDKKKQSSLKKNESISLAIKEYKSCHPMSEIVAKALFGPKKYASIKSLSEIDAKDWAYLEQTKNGIKELTSEAYCENFKCKKHPIVKSDRTLYVQYSVYQKDPENDKLTYIFCQTLVLFPDGRDCDEMLRSPVRFGDSNFRTYGKFHNFNPWMIVKNEEAVSWFRTLIHEGEVRGDSIKKCPSDDNLIPDDIVLKLGFLT